VRAEPQRNFATGAGSIGSLPGIEQVDFAFTAGSGPLGEDVSGTMFLRLVEGGFGERVGYIIADVKCLTVVGTSAGGGTAIIGGVIRQTNVAGKGFTQYFWATDSGDPNVPDSFGAFNSPLLPPPPEGLCVGSLGAVQPVTRGQITIRAAAP
jgi:hypothetical protein